MISFGYSYRPSHAVQLVTDRAKFKKFDEDLSSSIATPFLNSDVTFFLIKKKSYILLY